MVLLQALIASDLINDQWTLMGNYYEM